MEPIEARALWSHEVVAGEAGADGVFADCMVELSEGRDSEMRGLWFVVGGLPEQVFW